MLDFTGPPVLPYGDSQCHRTTSIQEAISGWECPHIQEKISGFGGMEEGNTLSPLT